ncbi:PTPLA-domain-containing protein [Lophium mytilinum]|uniref:Very-long-chain (3R)-3-hydroxyacyl-CoA dehydratase n=1 Tax=Lophium mytilinum TaxID=390894 RepID=A0A6A6QDJ0_9PEZI|nr:PTPLA-domain-containing protein [Lophium mytilinum]
MSTQSRPSSAKSNYLLAYNFVSAALWLTVLGRVVLISKDNGGPVKAAETGKVYQGLESFTRLVQTGALLEVVHSLVGIVRAPIFTTLTQVASRILLTWGVGYNFPQTTANSPAYSSMLLAWSVTEVVRYSYFVFVLGGVGVPGVLSWMRYNTFFLLYPIGISSECWLIYKAIAPASEWNPLFGYAFWGVLATYVPGAYMLYTYMMSQRRRVMRGKGKAKQ